MVFLTVVICVFCTAYKKACGQSPTLNTTQVIKTLVDSLPSADFYFIAQAHNNQANVPLEQELLFALHHKHGVRYDILEYSHSTAVLINEYLRTGDDSLLTAIDSNAPFTFIKSVKQYNDKISEERKIQFFGIDFEGRHNDAHLKKAMEVILHSIKADTSDTLYKLLNNIKNNSTGTTEKLLQQLKKILTTNEARSRQQLQHHYTDLLLISNAHYGMSSRRDKSMYHVFKLLYHELSKIDHAPKFIASFGYAHIHPGNKQGIAQQLEATEDSPVRDKVVMIGAQYYNTSYGREKERKEWVGNLNFLCRNIPATIKAIATQTDQPLHFISRAQIAQMNCNPLLNELDALILICNTSNVFYYTWE